MPVAELRAGQPYHLDRPYPGGESWRQAIARVGRFPWRSAAALGGQRVLLTGHTAARWRLDHHPGGIPLEELIGQHSAWQEGWGYQLGRFT